MGGSATSAVSLAAAAVAALGGGASFCFAARAPAFLFAALAFDAAALFCIRVCVFGADTSTAAGDWTVVAEPSSSLSPLLLLESLFGRSIAVRKRKKEKKRTGAGRFK
jgi:hypothetical protein